jgi:hypothetical protein
VIEFRAFPKIPRLTRKCLVTEKIDGTNASIFIGDDGSFLIGSRNRWITPDDDNFGFAKWATEHKDELLGLGVGHHFGEWWGPGIQRGYGVAEKRFSLFNVSRWSDPATRPACCHVVPVLANGEFFTGLADAALNDLERNGSRASPGFMRPEGVIVFHVASNSMFKKTILNDEQPKGQAA